MSRLKFGEVQTYRQTEKTHFTRSETSGGGGVFEPRTIQNAFLHLHLDHPSPPTKVGRPFSAFPNRAPSTVGRHADLWRPRPGPVRGAQSSGGHQPPRARFQVHTPALGRSGACRRGRARPQNGAERAAARLCSTAAHGWRARAGSGAGGGSMRAGGLNLALGAAPLLRWAARGAVRDGHPRRAGVVQKGLEPLARGARCRMRARRP